MASVIYGFSGLLYNICVEVRKLVEKQCKYTKMAIVTDLQAFDDALCCTDSKHSRLGPSV